MWSVFKHRNLTSDNKILWIRGEIAPEEQFLPFPTIFSIHISNYRSLITYSLVKFGCAICIFLNSENLICRSTDISKCFRGSLHLRDNESRLYFGILSISIVCLFVCGAPIPQWNNYRRVDLVVPFDCHRRQISFQNQTGFHGTLSFFFILPSSCYD